MIVWLSGWPQSGSALTRMIIQDTMGFPTFSCYKEQELEFLFGPITTQFWVNWNLAKLDECKNDNNLWLIKTHEIPLDDCKCIHFVRDGRNAVSSLARFWQMRPRDVIISRGTKFGGWSEHYYAQCQKKDRLFLKFEDMIANPDVAAKQIADYIGVGIKKTFTNRKDECVKRWPKLFKPRSGNYKEDMTPEELDLFMQCHGHAMKEMGYV